MACYCFIWQTIHIINYCQGNQHYKRIVGTHSISIQPKIFQVFVEVEINHCDQVAATKVKT